jgi:hypothetical protein
MDRKGVHFQGKKLIFWSGAATNKSLSASHQNMMSKMVKHLPQNK